jgi:hypothetical protein
VTDRPSFPYLPNFMATGSRLGDIELSFVPPYTSCTQNFPYLQFHPALALELACFTLPRFTKSFKAFIAPLIFVFLTIFLHSLHFPKIITMNNYKLSTIISITKSTWQGIWDYVAPITLVMIKYEYDMLL